jgi:hypothetical protein
MPSRRAAAAAAAAARPRRGQFLHFQHMIRSSASSQPSAWCRLSRPLMAHTEATCCVMTAHACNMTSYAAVIQQSPTLLPPRASLCL